MLTFSNLKCVNHHVLGIKDAKTEIKLKREVQNSLEILKNISIFSNNHGIQMIDTVLNFEITLI